MKIEEYLRTASFKSILLVHIIKKSVVPDFLSYHSNYETKRSLASLLNPKDIFLIFATLYFILVPEYSKLSIQLCYEKFLNKFVRANIFLNFGLVFGMKKVCFHFMKSHPCSNHLRKNTKRGKKRCNYVP